MTIHATNEERGEGAEFPHENAWIVVAGIAMYAVMSAVLTG